MELMDDERTKLELFIKFTLNTAAKINSNPLARRCSNEESNERF